MCVTSIIVYLEEQLTDNKTTYLKIVLETKKCKILTK